MQVATWNNTRRKHCVKIQQINNLLLIRFKIFGRAQKRIRDIVFEGFEPRDGLVRKGRSPFPTGPIVYSLPGRISRRRREFFTKQYPLFSSYVWYQGSSNKTHQCNQPNQSKKRMLVDCLVSKVLAILIISLFATVAVVRSVEAAPAAKDANNLYEIKIAAPEQEATPQPQLIQQAFKDILVRLSGSEKILNDPRVTKAISEVDNYVSLFGYQIAADQQRVFRVRFDDVLMNQLIESTGQPILDKKRPNVVVWLTTKQNDVTEWVGGESQNELSLELESMAKKRGLSLVLPLLDLTDTALVTEQKVWNEEFKAIETASKRYNAEQILIGRLSKQASGWYGQWTYLKDGQQLKWELSNAELSNLLKEALDSFVVRMSGANANASAKGQASASTAEGEGFNPNANQNKNVRLAVFGISGADQYARVTKYLKGLPQIESVEVAEISPDHTVFNLKTRNGKENLVKTLALGKILVDQTAANANADGITQPASAEGAINVTGAGNGESLADTANAATSTETTGESTATSTTSSSAAAAAAPKDDFTSFPPSYEDAKRGKEMAKELAKERANPQVADHSNSFPYKIIEVF